MKLISPSPQTLHPPHTIYLITPMLPDLILYFWGGVGGLTLNYNVIVLRFWGGELGNQGWETKPLGWSFQLSVSLLRRSCANSYQ
ncbi:hypothetical protein AFK68_22900 [Hydrocoleum sp. CS-953]|nr:hypothetical protein AFK68_22900 [Hydrocoleum sp. CS-953]